MMSSAPGRVGGNLFPTMPGCVFPKVKDFGPFPATTLQEGELRENISLKMCVKFVASLNMGKNLF